MEIDKTLNKEFMSQTKPLSHALISVSDKTGIEELAKALARNNIEIISTGGTAKAIREAGVHVTDVGEFTGWPEMFDGRLKTIHPKVAGGVLYRRDKPAHVAQANQYDIADIDFVIINFYPFEQTIAKPGTSFEEAVEQIDIGGPSLVRAAAKNYESVTVLTCPIDYDRTIQELDANNGKTSLKWRRLLMGVAFRMTANYDTAVFKYLDEDYKRKATAPK